MNIKAYNYGRVLTPAYKRNVITILKDFGIIVDELILCELKKCKTPKEMDLFKMRLIDEKLNYEG